jgi:pimeloyl-ACP methyl ester carboxylesterase
VKSSSMALLLGAATCVMAAVPTSQVAADTGHVCFDVDVRGGQSELCAAVFEGSSPIAQRVGATLLAVHGLTETAQTWEPLASALFADKTLKHLVRRVVAIDLPGHGASEAPTGLPGGVRFGDLTIHDNLSIVIQAIDTLRAQGMGAQVIMGHSMGGLAVQGVQEVLLDQGSSLAKHGIKGAILIAPVPAAGAQWTQPPASDLTPFVVTDPALGSYLDIPPFVGRIAGGFTTFAGTQVPGTPTEAKMADYLGWEPITVALQLVGQIPPLPRPDAREGAFALRNGTVLMVVSFSQDVLTPQVDHDDLYRYLLGRPGLLFRPITTPEAVHNMHITDPVRVLRELRDLPLMLQ